jgi:hypothetical protein
MRKEEGMIGLAWQRPIIPSNVKRSTSEEDHLTMHKDTRGPDHGPGGNASDTGVPLFIAEAVTSTLRDLVYCHTSTMAQVCRATGAVMGYDVRRYLHRTFLQDHPFVSIHAGEFFDVLHDLHFDVIAR